MTRQNTVQDLMISDLLEFNDDSAKNETIEMLDFMKQNGTPLTKDQAQAFFLLQEFQLFDIAQFVNTLRPNVTNPKMYFQTIDKITLADRIKGNAKLSNLLKANANPANGLTAKDVQAQGMKRSEIDK